MKKFAYKRQMWTSHWFWKLRSGQASKWASLRTISRMIAQNEPSWQTDNMHRIGLRQNNFNYGNSMGGGGGP